MLKYVNAGIVFQEIPDEVTLSINLSNCPCRCPGCHSSYLWGDVGKPLTPVALDEFLAKYASDITCVCFMGGDSDPAAVNGLAGYLRQCYPQLKVAWYSGRTILSPAICRSRFDYIKIGPYIRHLGGLRQPTTNQRLYRIGTADELIDITSCFWNRNRRIG